MSNSTSNNRGLRQFAAALVSLVTLSITACGGGGGGNESGHVASRNPTGRNLTPVADAGGDQIVAEQSTVTLDGTASTDPDGDSISLRWEQKSGIEVTLSGSQTAQPTFSAPELFEVGSVESLVFEVTVSDSKGASSKDTVIVEVEVELPDANRFLTYLNASSPLYEESEQSAEAYYEAIDPGRQKTTLDDWLAANGFNQGHDARAVYRNAADLGFGRVMTMRTNADGSVASYVENYPTLEAAIDAVVNDTRDQLLATVAMEYSAHPDNPNGPKYTKFYTFVGALLAPEYGVADGARLTKINLDGRGDKFQPGVCNVCHGGQPQPLVDGKYPDNGYTGAQFLPWDLDTFEFSTDPLFTRVAQEGEFKKLNKGALSTYPATPTSGQWSGESARELIHGWYGGPTLPQANFDGDFVPPGWASSQNGGPQGNPPNSEELYLDVVAPNCRACHVQRGRYFPTGNEGEFIDFTSYAKFMAYEEETRDLVFDLGQMPDARLTFDRFWSEQNGVVAGEELAAHLEINLEANPLGRPVSDPGPNRFAPLIPGRISFVDLSGTGSRFAETFSWTFADVLGQPSNSDAAILGDRTATPTLAFDVPGSYRVQLVVGNGIAQSDPEIVVVTAFNGFTERSFVADVAPVIEAQCGASCHGIGNAQSVPGIPVLFDDPSSLYDAVLSLVNLEDVAQSPILRKPTGHLHGGGVRRGNDGIVGDGFEVSGDFGADRGAYDTVLEWITQGAKNN